MKIETKFDINQEIYFIVRGEQEAKGGKIHSIHPDIKEVADFTFTRYGITDENGYALRLPEEQIFATKEEAEAKLEEIQNDREKTT